MPELPEVETIARELKAKISGKKLRKFLVFDKRLGRPWRASLKRAGRLHLPLPLKISSVGRHGKYIVFHANGGKILLHLRMTGRLLLRKQQSGIKATTEKHERARFVFSGNLILKFFDPRRFGTIEWRKEKLPELGLNPLEPEFSDKNFKEAVFSRSRAIKSLLLDQKIISGLGNIYADESLWFAKISPLRKSDSLSEKEASLLRASIAKVLRSAINKGGFTMRDYRKTGGEPGSYQHFRKVYKREGLLCSRCGGKIKRIKIGGRSAHICPECQK